MKEWETEKRLAVTMWQGIADGIAAGNIKDGHEVGRFKREFCAKHGLQWQSDCFLCEHYVCPECPLGCKWGSCRSEHGNPYILLTNHGGDDYTRCPETYAEYAKQIVEALKCAKKDGHTEADLQEVHDFVWDSVIEDIEEGCADVPRRVAEAKEAALCAMLAMDRISPAEYKRLQGRHCCVLCLKHKGDCEHCPLGTLSGKECADSGSPYDMVCDKDVPRDVRLNIARAIRSIRV